MATHIRFLSDPPRQRYSAREHTRHASFLNPRRQTQPPFSRYMRHLRVEQGLAWCARTGSGEGRGGEPNRMYSMYRSDDRRPPEIDTSMRPARHCSHWQLLRSTIEGEDRRRERRGCGTPMRGCGRMAILLYATQDPATGSNQTVSAASLVGAGGRWTSFMLEFMF